MKALFLAIVFAGSIYANAAGFDGTYAQSSELCSGSSSAPKHDKTFKVYRFEGAFYTFEVRNRESDAFVTYTEQGTYSATGSAIAFTKLISMDESGKVSHFANYTYTDECQFTGSKLRCVYGGFGQNGDCQEGDTLVLELTRK